MTPSRPIVLIAFSILGIVLLCAGYWYGVQTPKGNSLASDPSACHRTYDLLDQLLDCEKLEDATARVSELEENVTSFIDEKKKNREVMRISAFYRDLNSRRWFGVDADGEYYPASLVKLPLAVTYYKVADLEPAVLEQPLKLVSIPEYANANQRVSVDSPMEIGKEYSTRRMIDDMIVYSDNRPIGPLISFMREDVWKKVYSDLGVRRQLDDKSEDWSVSPRTLSAIFRSLFNASYLDLDSSQLVLEMLSKARYAKGLVAGVPTSVRVAHKFGEATMVEDDGKQTPILHDCGIIYKPDEPYILCIMTEGKNFDMLEQTIADISRMVYDAQ